MSKQRLLSLLLQFEGVEPDLYQRIGLALADAYEAGAETSLECFRETFKEKLDL